MSLNPEHWPRAVEETVFVLSLGAFVVPLLVLLALKFVGGLSQRRMRALFSTAGFLLVFVNPLLQLLSLGPIDSVLRDRWMQRAEEEHLVGMTPDEVRALLGDPCQIRNEHPSVSGPSGSQQVVYGYTAWDYVPIPFFWMSHADHFKVFIEGGRVTSFKRGSSST